MGKAIYQDEAGTPSTPSSGHHSWYPKSDGFYMLDDAGNESRIGTRHNFAATTAPGVTNDIDEGYTVGSLWIDTTADNAYICQDNTDGAAVWAQIDGSGGASQLSDLSDVSAAAQTANFVMAAGDGATGGDYNGRALVEADIPDLSGTYAPAAGGDGLDTSAIHDDTAGEIGAVSEKASPVSGDLILLEDSEAGGAKKSAQLGNLPGGGGGANTTLSNLTSPTAINQDLLPGSTEALGSAAARWPLTASAVDFYPYTGIITLSSGVADFTGVTNERQILLNAESGSTGELTSITNISIIGLFILQANAGDTITITHNGTTIKLHNEGQLVLTDADRALAWFDGSSMHIYTVSEFDASKFAIVDGTDNTKKVAVDASGITTANTRTLTMPDADVDLGSDFADASHVHDASVITYTPDDNTNWDSSADPGNLDDALDQLAGRTNDLEEGMAIDSSFVDITLSSGVATLTASSICLLNIQAQTGTAGDLTSFTNAPHTGLYIVKADVGDVITIKHDGVNIFINDTADAVLNENSYYLMFITSADVAYGMGFFTHTHDASGITYTPSALTDWDSSSDPGDIDDATDQLAARVKTLEGAGGGGATMAIGTYTGDGNATQAITGVGFQPEFLVTLRREDVFGYDYFKSDQDTTSARATAGSAYKTDHIISLDADGFTVGDGTGDANYANVNTKSYTYIAFKA